MAKERVKAKREQQAAQRAATERKKRLTSLIWRTVGALGLVGGIAWCGHTLLTERRLANAVAITTYSAGLHIAGPVAYKETPPMGGAHNVVWQNCGIYSAPIHNEHAVHALEHGAVWISYRPELPADEFQRLRELAADDYMLLSPYPGLRAPVVATAWNRQIALTGANDPLLSKFIASFKNNPSTTPEFGASCSGGTSVTGEADSLKVGPATMAR